MPATSPVRLVRAETSPELPRAPGQPAPSVQLVIANQGFGRKHAVNSAFELGSAPHGRGKRRVEKQPREARDPRLFDAQQGRIERGVRQVYVELQIGVGVLGGQAWRLTLAQRPFAEVDAHRNVQFVVDEHVGDVES